MRMLEMPSTDQRRFYRIDHPGCQLEPKTKRGWKEILSPTHLGRPLLSVRLGMAAVNPASKATRDRPYGVWGIRARQLGDHREAWWKNSSVQV